METILLGICCCFDDNIIVRYTLPTPEEVDDLTPRKLLYNIYSDHVVIGI